MSASGTISNLQQALNCAGKCDCCANLQQQINQLKAQINNIKQVDENAITKRVEASIIPQISNITLPLIFTNINPLKNRITGVENLAGDGLAKAREALEKAYVADSAARGASNAAQGAAAKAAQALAAIAGLLVSIAALAVAIGSINALGGRIDAVENGLSQLGADVGRILGGIIPPIKSQAQRAETKADEAKAGASNAYGLASLASATASQAQGTANNSVGIASSASATASQSQGTATNAKATADTANKKADEMRSLIAPLPSRIDEARRKADDAKRKADDADRKAEEAKRAFPPIERIARAAQGTADEAVRRLNEILRNPPKGLKGEPGKDGITRIITLPGRPGRDGIDGKDGITRIITLPGRPGRDGIDGIDGKDGKDVNPADLQRLERKLDRIPPLFAAIPKPLDFSQTVNAAATGTCRTTQPGGCTNRLVNNAANNINQNVNKGFGNLLNKLSNLANLTLLPIINNTTQTINATLGAPISKLGGGTTTLTNFVSESFTRTFKFFNWAVLDRVLNLMIAATTIHNAAMLSNDIGQTLLGVVGNILQIFGINDSDGKAYDISDIVGTTIQNLIKGLIGETNYQNLSEGWAKANRIYQASINIFNAVQGLLSTVLNALEITAGRVGKIGNALRKSGEVLDNAYTWMNPQPKFNRITNSLEALQNGASTIQMVTQAPLDVVNAVTETTNAATEFTKALKEDEKPENKGLDDKEPDKLKTDELTSKTASAGLEMSDLDLEADEDIA